MSKTFGVLIIEDDFRVAEINRQFIEQSPGFQVVGVVKSKAETEAFMAQHAESIDLVLLDAYIPDVNGLELLWSLRRDHKHLDIIMITAAKEVETIQEALRGGVFDYLIKPTESTRMAQTLERFATERALLQSHQELNQDELDAALSRGVRSGAIASKNHLFASEVFRAPSFSQAGDCEQYEHNAEYASFIHYGHNVVDVIIAS